MNDLGIALGILWVLTVLLIFRCYCFKLDERGDK